MEFTRYNAVGLCEIPQERISQASALFSLFFQLGMALGVAVSALLLQLAIRGQGHGDALQVSDSRWA